MPLTLQNMSLSKKYKNVLFAYTYFDAVVLLYSIKKIQGHSRGGYNNMTRRNTEMRGYNYYILLYTQMCHVI